MKRLFSSAAMLPAFALLASCGGTAVDNDNVAMMQNDVATNDMMGDMYGNDMMANSAMDVADMTPQQFADKAAQSDAFEIQSAKIAESKATSQQIKDFAEKMVADHSKSTENLKTAAAKVDGVTPDDTLPAEMKEKIDALNAANGDAFDALYIQQQKDAHQKAIDLLRGYADAGSAAPFKDFASQTAPVVQSHIEMLDTM